MTTPEIINYVRQQIAIGVSREQISASLKQNGWNDADIAEAFAAITTPASSIPHAPQVAIRSSHKLRNIIIFFVLLALLGGAGWWWFYGKQSAPVVQNEVAVSDNKVEPILAVKKDDFKVTYTSVPVEENSASIFNAIPDNKISKEDKVLLNDYLDNSASLADLKKILAKYKYILKEFEAGTSKNYYQCSLNLAENCRLDTLRYIPNLAALNSFVLFKEGKYVDAQNYAEKIIKLGQMLTANTDDITNLLVGWDAQKIGYYALRQVEPTYKLSADTKASLIKSLREEHKKVFQFIYSRHIEGIDYITDISKKPSGLIDKDTEDFFAEYRKMANSTTWKPEIVKKWFLDSLKIELANIDLPCGTLPEDSMIDIGFDSEDLSKTENFVGRTMYYTTYSSLNNSSLKRCEVESLVNAL